MCSKGNWITIYSQFPYYSFWVMFCILKCYIILNDWLFFLCHSLTVCQFAARGDMEWFVVVGTARDLILNPRSCSGGCLLLYRLAPDGNTMEFVHMVSKPYLPHMISSVFFIALLTCIYNYYFCYLPYMAKIQYKVTKRGTKHQLLYFCDILYNP